MGQIWAVQRVPQKLSSTLCASLASLVLPGDFPEANPPPTCCAASATGAPPVVGRTEGVAQFRWLRSPARWWGHRGEAATQLFDAAQTSKFLQLRQRIDEEFDSQPGGCGRTGITARNPPLCVCISSILRDWWWVGGPTPPPTPGSLPQTARPDQGHSPMPLKVQTACSWLNTADTEAAGAPSSHAALRCSVS